MTVELALHLWQQYQAAISRTLMSYEADPALRQDLAQEAYLALHRSAEKLSQVDNKRAYVFRIVHNVVVDHIAGATRMAWQPLEEQHLNELQSDCPSVAFSSQQQNNVLLQAVRQLALSHRQVITLAMEDIEEKEIADILGISYGAVRVRMNRAKAALQEILQHATAL